MTKQKYRPTRRGGKRHKKCRSKGPATEISNVVNLSKRLLSVDETAVLEKGLSFVPSKKADPFTTKIELFKFFRSVKLRAFFTKDSGSITSDQFTAAPNLSDSERK